MGLARTCKLPETCASAKITSSRQCAALFVDDEPTPVCAGAYCTSAEFGNATSTCCTWPQLCADGMAAGFECGGNSLNKTGSPRCVKLWCDETDFVDPNAACCTCEPQSGCLLSSGESSARAR